MHSLGAQIAVLGDRVQFFNRSVASVVRCLGNFPNSAVPSPWGPTDEARCTLWCTIKHLVRRYTPSLPLEREGYLRRQSFPILKPRRRLPRAAAAQWRQQVLPEGLTLSKVRRYEADSDHDFSLKNILLDQVEKSEDCREDENFFPLHVDRSFLFSHKTCVLYTVHCTLFLCAHSRMRSGALRR